MSVLGHQYIVFDANPAPARYINSRLDRDNHPGGKLAFGDWREEWGFVDSKPKPVSQAMTKLFAETSALDRATGSLVDLPQGCAGSNLGNGCQLRFQYDFVYFTQFRRDSSGHQNTRQVARAYPLYLAPQSINTNGSSPMRRFDGIPWGNAPLGPTPTIGSKAQPVPPKPRI